MDFSALIFILRSGTTSLFDLLDLSQIGIGY